jgi:hypothetical protein
MYWRLRGLRDPAQVALSIALSVSVTAASMYGWAGLMTWPALLWLIAIAMLAALWVLGVFVWFKPTYADLEQQKAKAEEKLREAEALARADVDEHRGALQGALDELLMQLHKYVCGDVVDTRVSVYSAEAGEFILLARYSLNPLLERRGRSSYPLAQGAIGVAWAKRWVIDNSEDESRATWEASLVAGQGFSADEAAGLTMHARSIYAARLDRGQSKAGVVVFECEEPDRFTVKTTAKVERSYLRETLAAVVSASHVYFPRVKERQTELANVAVLPSPQSPPWKPTERPKQDDIAVGLTE